MRMWLVSVSMCVYARGEEGFSVRRVWARSGIGMVCESREGDTCDQQAKQGTTHILVLLSVNWCPEGGLLSLAASGNHDRGQA